MTDLLHDRRKYDIDQPVKGARLIELGIAVVLSSVISAGLTAMLTVNVMAERVANLQASQEEIKQQLRDLRRDFYRPAWPDEATMELDVTEFITDLKQSLHSAARQFEGTQADEDADFKRLLRASAADLAELRGRTRLGEITLAAGEYRYTSAPADVIYIKAPLWGQGKRLDPWADNYPGPLAACPRAVRRRHPGDLDHALANAGADQHAWQHLSVLLRRQPVDGRGCRPDLPGARRRPRAAVAARPGRSGPRTGPDGHQPRGRDQDQDGAVEQHDADRAVGSPDGRIPAPGGGGRVKVSISHTLPRFIQALRRTPDMTLEEVDRVVGGVAVEGARTAGREAPKAVSTLRDSIIAEKVGEAFWQFRTRVDYARYVEEGTGPGGRPPIEAIRRWIRQHQIQPRQARDERGLAFLIARSIERKGTPAQPFMEPARQTSQQRLMARLPEAARRGMEVALS